MVVHVVSLGVYSIAIANNVINNYKHYTSIDSYVVFWVAVNVIHVLLINIYNLVTIVVKKVSCM